MKRFATATLVAAFGIGLLVACQAALPDTSDAQPPHADLVIRNGLIYDGSGSSPVRGDVAVADGRIIAVGKLGPLSASQEVDVHGLAVAPGFINMLSWATESLIEDGRALSDVKQGVTLEVMGEGWSMGPLNARMKQQMVKEQGDIRFDVAWTTLGEYLEHLERRGISVNVASFVGAATVRIHELDHANRAPTPEELARMQALVCQAMEEGALGVGSSLIYAPAFYARTDELKALVAAAATYGGGYISHIRNEGDQFLEALDELIDIARSTGAHAEAYHLKAAGRDNWHKMAQAIDKIERARKSGLPITADMYPYPAGATGLDACMDPAVKEGGTDAWVERLKQPEVRKAVVAAMFRKPTSWENICYNSGSPENIMLVGFKEETLKPYTGKTLAEVAKLRGTSPAETVVDLVIEDHTRVGTVFFQMSEANVELGLSQPWVSLGSDGEALAPEGVFLKSNPHPRAYGTFARFLGKYVRDEKVASLADGIRRLTALPADNFKLRGRGRLARGYAADLVVFDPSAITDHATFEKPHQFASGVQHVWVNGVQVLKDGEHTGAKPGQVVRGPGYAGPESTRPPANGTAAGRIARVEHGLRHAVVVAGISDPAMKLAERLRYHRVPGLSVAVIDNFELDWAKGYGLRQAGGTDVVTPEIRFQAASISKPVAALAALRLVEDGRLRLDEPVSARLRSWTIPASEHTRAAPVTLRHLLSHSAGLTVHGFDGYANAVPVPTLQQILDGVPPANSAPIRVDQTPGAVWRYSGGGYSVLQQLLLDVSQESFARHLQRTVLAPLGMRHSSYDQPLPATQATQAAIAHTEDGKPIEGQWHVYPELAAAGLWTTPTDLARFLSEIMKADSGREAVISAGTARTMLTVQPELKADGVAMGLGVFLEKEGQARRFSHGGSNAGYRAYAIAFPETGQGAVIMTNGDSGAVLIQEVLRAIAAEYAWPDPMRARKAAAPGETPIDQALLGRYRVTAGPVVEIVADENALAAVIGERDPVVLTRESADRYFSIESGTELIFRRDPAGNVSGFSARPLSGATFEAQREIADSKTSGVT